MTRARVAHLVVTLAGLLIVLYPVTVGAQPDISCRGVAMGQAPLEVQEAADDVTETVDRDGVAVELGRWF